MLVDEVTIKLRGGHGGKGAVAFNKVPLMLGPVGGDGGNGGSIWLEGVSDIGALATFSRLRSIHAENGKDGRGQLLDGRAGEDMTLKIPVGTRITRLVSPPASSSASLRGPDASVTVAVRTASSSSSPCLAAEAHEDSQTEVLEMTEVGQRIQIVKGGRGGKGNYKFRSSTNTSPQEFQEGLPGDEANFLLELRLIADVGLVGLPNAGKSSLLNELTAAQSKVGNYAFTTLEVNLGSHHGIIIADIPGLIEGASEGKGLGIKFLKHIERTRTIFHLISAESEDPVLDYGIIRRELEDYDEELIAKPEHVFLTKCDVVTPERLKEQLKALKKIDITATAISVLDDKTLEAVKKALRDVAKGK